MQSNTTLPICIGNRCFYIVVLTTTCFGRYIGHHQVVYFLIFDIHYIILYYIILYIISYNIYYILLYYILLYYIISYHIIYIYIIQCFCLVDKNILYFMVCFKNKRMYNLMMADIAAERCRC